MGDYRYIARGKFLNFKKSRVWRIQIRAKNKNKNGRRFKYADSMFETLALIKSCTCISYRACEGIARGILRDDVPDHTTICRRINALDVTLNYDEHAYRTYNDCTMLTVDSGCLQLNDRGGLIRAARIYQDTLSCGNQN